MKENPDYKEDPSIELLTNLIMERENRQKPKEKSPSYAMGSLTKSKSGGSRELVTTSVPVSVMSRKSARNEECDIDLDDDAPDFLLDRVVSTPTIFKKLKKIAKHQAVPLTRYM